MNDDQQHQPPMNGNDDLAKTLNAGLQFEETPMNGSSSSQPADSPSTEDDLKMPSLAPDNNATKDDAPTMGTTPPPVDEPDDDDTDDTTNDTTSPDDDSNQPATSSTGNSELDSIKASALDALRPLVGKLNLPAEERFDTLLLIIRSTDDQNLLQQAHDAAKEITDDSRRAQALLDVIKEIDYFSHKR